VTEGNHSDLKPEHDHPIKPEQILYDHFLIIEQEGFFCWLHCGNSLQIRAVAGERLIRDVFMPFSDVTFVHGDLDSIANIGGW